MIVRLACGALQGVDAFRVDLEVDFLLGKLINFPLKVVLILVALYYQQ